MSSFGRHSHYHRNKHHGISPFAIIAICVVAALIISLIVGNLLKIFLDEDAYNRLVAPKSEPTVTDPVVTDVPDVQAYSYLWGTPTQGLKPHVSVNLNTQNGVLNYRSPVSQALALRQTEAINFTNAMIALTASTDYISGIFYPQGSNEENTDIRYAIASQEHAILYEFLENGGDDILLCGLDLTDLTTAKQITDYVKILKKDLGAPVGVSVPLSVAQSERGWEILATLLQSCDFCALDLRDAIVPANQTASEYLKGVSYYLLQCDMRLLLTSEQTEFIETVEETSIQNYQIMKSENTDDNSAE